MRVLLVLLIVFSICYGHVRQLPKGEPSGSGDGTIVQLRMPGIVPQKNDDYLCTAFNLEQEGELFITQFKIEGTAERAHHMLLYGCEDVPSKDISWDCGHHGVCSGSSSIMFAWAKNAPPTSLPPSVGFRMGVRSGIKYVVMQIHYAHTLPPGEKDYSGMDLDVTHQQQKYIAGIYLLIGGATIPPFTPKVHADACCVVNTPAPFNLFAYRTHAHALGRVISGYKHSKKTGQLEEIAKGNPQWPQAFYGMPHVFEVETGDILMARCTYDSTNKNTTTYMGSTAGDEMCNLYLMYFTDAQKGKSYDLCTSNCNFPFPAGSDVPLPPNPLLEEHALHGNHGQQNGTITISDKMSINLEKLDYNNIFGGKEANGDLIPEPEKKNQFTTNHVHRKPGTPVDEIYDDNNVEEEHQTHPTKSTTKPEPVIEKVYADNYVSDPKWLSSIQTQPSAVAIDSKGRIIVFHRSDRAWGGNTFGINNRLANSKQGPIKNTTLILLNPINSKVIREAGQNMFYVPHGLTVDQHDYLWVTDVGAHQVYKLSPLTADNPNKLKVLMELGKKLEPGSGDGEFCKPTSVAVLPSGEFFVADGYCNSRIIKYTKDGVKISEWGEKIATNPMNIPHSLTLVPESNSVCVADRENGRIQCFSISDGQFQKMIKLPEFKSYVYAISYQGGYLYAVNGPTSAAGETIRAKGFIIDMKGSGEIVSVFGSKASTQLGMPHGIAIGPNASSIYIAEINPYRVVKLVQEGSLTPSSSLQSTATVSNHGSFVDESPAADHSILIDLDMSSISTSMIILSILAVPLLIIVIIVAITRLRKRGCCSSSKRTAKLDLGSLLGHRDPIRGGFEKLAMEDSDGDGEIDSDSDADVVEYTKAKRGANFKA